MEIFGIKISNSDLWLLGCAGILLAWLTSHRLSISRDLMQKRRASADAIIAAFQAELTAILQSNGDIGQILTKQVFKRHEAAIITNSRNLDWFKKWRLQKEWHRLAFHESDRRHQLPFYEQYLDAGSLNKRRSIRPLAIQRIEKIISILA